MALSQIERRRYFDNWRKLAQSAIDAAADPSADAPGLLIQGSIAQTDWVVPLDGRAAGFLVVSFAAACKAWGASARVRDRARMADALAALGHALLALVDAAEAGEPPHLTVVPTLPFRQDIDG